MRWALAATAFVWAFSASARADVEIRTSDGGSWSSAVADLIERLGSEGDVLRLCVSDGAHEACLPCERYALTLEGDGAEAFVIGACDEASGATLVQLVDRSALFDHAHAIPTPRSPGLSARLLVTAEPAVTETTGCIATVRAFARDPEHGTFVRLSPDRFTLQTDASDVRVVPSADVFVLSSEGPVETHYAIRDASGTLALEGDASLVCPEPPVPRAPPAPAPHATMTSGIQLHPVSPLHQGAVALEYGGFGIAGLGLVTLAVIGFLVLADLASLGCSFGAAFDPGTPHVCGTAIAIPPEVTYAALGALGIGATAGSLGLGIDATRGADPDRAQIAVGVRF